MADTKTSDEIDAGTLTGAELLRLVQAGANRKVTLDDIAAFIAAGISGSLPPGGAAGDVLKKSTDYDFDVEWGPESGGGGGGGASIVRVTDTSETDFSTTSTSFVDVPGMSVSIAAAAGDLVEVQWDFSCGVASGSGVGGLQTLIVVGSTGLSGSYFDITSSGNPSQAVSVRCFRLIESGDISGGEATFKAQVKRALGGTFAIFNRAIGSATPIQSNFSAKNWGSPPS